MPTAPLTADERAYLLALARSTIEKAADAPSSVTGASVTVALDETALTPRLRAPGAAFVTLHHTRSRALRGCIGSLVAHRPLIDDVRENAVAAAFRDPRFSPVRAEELDNIVVEVSVLTPPEKLDFDGPDDLLCKLHPNVDGVLIERGWNRGTFLPQVWEQLPLPEEFMTNLCFKAGLPGNAWRWSDLDVSIYQVEEFEEKT